MVDAPVPVLIVDDQAPFRRAAAAVVRLTPGFKVVGEAESGEAAVELVESLHPALVLMDINMGGINGIEATRRITASHPDVVVLLLSTYQADDLPSDASTSGYAAYVNKDEFGPGILTRLWEGRPDDGAAGCWPGSSATRGGRAPSSCSCSTYARTTCPRATTAG